MTYRTMDNTEISDEVSNKVKHIVDEVAPLLRNVAM